MQFDVYPPLTLTSKGKRPLNEDYVFAPINYYTSQQKPLVFLVCDGVGGEAKGEVASRMVGTMVGEELTDRDPAVQAGIAEAVSRAQQAMRQYTLENDDARGMATTLSLLVFDRDGATIAHMGDSRVYQFRDGSILHQTKDHSFVQELLSNELITEEQAKEHPRKNVITRAVMQSPNPAEPELMNTSDLRPEDVFLLCSDGVLEAFSDDELCALVADQSLTDEERITKIDQQCADRSRDNYTACFVRVKSVTYISPILGNKATRSLKESLKSLIKKLASLEDN